MTNKLELTCALIRPTNISGACNSISKNGEFIYIVYSLFNESKLAAELFCNNNGRLLAFNKINVDDQFPIINGGYASNSFHRYTILDSTNNICRLRLFDKNLNLLTSKLFKDYYSTGCSFKGGNFSSDDKYISVTFVYDCNIGKNYQKSVLRIFNADNLNEIVCYKYDGYTPINTNFFYLDNNLYLMLSSIGGKFDISNHRPRAPALLKILKLSKTQSIDLAYEVELPQFFRFDFIKTSNNSIYILVGTDRANICQETIICNKPNKSFIENDGNEFRIYKFKKDKLKLMVGKKYGLDLNVKFYPFNRIIALIKSNSINNIVNILEFIKLDTELNTKEYLNGPIILPYKSEINFSEDGKWMIITGVSENYFQKPCFIKNILLFKVMT